MISIHWLSRGTFAIVAGVIYYFLWPKGK